ncbi:MAG: succinate dehydrogenase iron-sulfur subunit [Candidatus Eisenbacteria bacterium]|jgi:succinate dehydrogenase / fumarate reductase iron-sulfur subunit|nr:succinate dehydrogenase iron-sulfur subunit [Candidatus Eisenbacteria bacterium]
MERQFKIYRFNPEAAPAASFQTYTVDIQHAWTVLDALNAIKWDQDGSLSFRRSCRHGICGSCAMKINGKNGLACEVQVESLKGVITVEPLPGFKVIRDLVTDMDGFFSHLEAVKPWLIAGTPPTDKERVQSPEDRKLIDGLYECILCGACTSACPSYWVNDDFLGPAALLKAARYVMDTRDDGLTDRLDVLDSRNGIWRCHTIFNCVEACPKSLNPTEAIVKLRQKLAALRI